MSGIQNNHMNAIIPRGEHALSLAAVRSLGKKNIETRLFPNTKKLSHSDQNTATIKLLPVNILIFSKDYQIMIW
jgi:hypothetical protein